MAIQQSTKDDVGLTKRDPFVNWQVVDVQFPATPHSDYVIRHTLTVDDPKNVHYRIIKQFTGGTVYEAPDSQWTPQFIVLRSDTTNWTGRLLLGTLDDQTNFDTTAYDIPTSAAWQAYTPAWTSSGTQPTNGTFNVARYRRDGDTVFVQITMSMTGSTTFGTGIYFWSLPVNCPIETMCMGSAFLFDNGTNGRLGVVQYASATTISVAFDTGAVAVGATAPFTWASGDYITMNFSYKAA